MATQQPEPERWHEIRALWQQYQWLYILAGVLIGVLLSPLLQAMSDDFSEFLKDLAPEAVGIGFTVLFIDRLYQRREEEKRVKDLKVRLVREVGSKSNEVAKRAVDEIHARGWLTSDEGLLREANLRYANLAGVNLIEANLDGANLFDTHLKGTRLYKAQFSISSQLPDGSKWTPNTDLDRFTDPNHSEFWRSDSNWPPAYRKSDDQ